MVRFYLFAFLLTPLVADAQPDTYPAVPRQTGLQYPIANQFEHLSVNDGLSNNSVNCILQDREGYMWFGTHDGLNKYDGATFTVFQPNPAQPARSLQNSTITGLCEGGPNQVWAITEAGLHEIDTRTGRVTPHLIRGAGASRWNNQISIYSDGRGTLWISTFAGLVRYQPARHRFTLYPAPMANMPVKTVFEDRQHRFWVATHQGLYLFDRTTGCFTLVPVAGLSTGTPQPSFMSFYLDDADVLWLGTATEGYSLFKLDLRQRPWQLIPYNPGGQLSPYVWRNTLHRDSTGLVWVGTTNGLHAIDPISDNIVTYRTDANLAKGLGSSSAQAVYHDRAGSLWVGTDNGIDRQAAGTKPFQVYRLMPDKRLSNRPENRVNTLAADSRGQLWLSTDKGLCRVDPQTKAVHSYEVTDGLPSNEFLQNAVFGQPGQLFFGSRNGLVRFSPNQVLDDTRPFPVYITDLTVLDKPRALTGGVVRLRHDENRVSFGFAALAYEQPGQNQYAYQLAGVNPTWVPNGNRHVANFTNPAPGTYTFRVKAANSSGFWSGSVASVRVVVQPPWWATWWAYALYVLLLTGGIWSFTAYRSRTLRRENRVLEDKVSLRTSQLQQSLTELKTTQNQLIQKEKMASLGELTAGIAHEIQNPLNFVNNFSEISVELIADLEAEQQQPHRNIGLEADLLSDLKRNLQKITHHGDRASNIVKSMLEHSRTSTGERQPTKLNALCDKFLRLAYHGLRTKDEAFTCELVTRLDPALPLVEVSPQDLGRALLNLFNNAFYAVQQRQKAGEAGYRPAVTVSTEQHGGQVEIQVRDNGTGIPETVMAKIFQPFSPPNPPAKARAWG